MGNGFCPCFKKTKDKITVIDNFSDADQESFIRHQVSEIKVEEFADTEVIEARCPHCNRKLKKVKKRPISNYTWSCDNCLDRHPVKPGFEFYSCK